MDDLVVTHWPSEVESTAPLDFLLRYGLWTPFGCPMSCKIGSIISAAYDFTTKSDGIWKYALALEQTDPGFDASVLSEFRTRLVQGGAEPLLLEPLLQQLEAHDLLKARGTQRTDSTHILAAIQTLNRLALVGETMRYALNRLAVATPAWLQAQLQPAWAERYGHRVENYRLPKADAERQQLAATIGADGFALLHAAYGPKAPPAVREAPAVEVLRQIWVQQYYGPADPPRWLQRPRQMTTW
jgi:transposase